MPVSKDINGMYGISATATTVPHSLLQLFIRSNFSGTQLWIFLFLSNILERFLHKTYFIYLFSIVTIICLQSILPEKYYIYIYTSSSRPNESLNEYAINRTINHACFKSENMSRSAIKIILDSQSATVWLTVKRTLPTPYISACLMGLLKSLKFSE